MRGEPEIEDEEDGPPPGFDSIITPHPPQLNYPSEEAEAGDQCDSGEEGPPPGFRPFNLPPPFPSSDTETGGKQNDIEDEEDGPPPGWEFNAPFQMSTSKPPSNTTDIETRGKQDSIEDDLDGPPPGWEFSTSSQALPSKPQSNTAGPSQMSTSKQPSNAADIEMRGKQDSIEDDLDGPPPGWEFSMPSQALPSKPQSNTADMKMRGKHDEFEDDGDGPPPGWEFCALSQALPSKLPSESLLDTADIKMAGNELHEDEDDGPPPGWETTIPHQMVPPYKSPLWASLASSSGHEMGSKGEIKTDEEVHPSRSQPESKLEQLPAPTPPPQLLVSSADMQMGNREVDIKNEGKRLASVPSPQSVQPKNLQSPQQPAPPPVASSSLSGQSTEKAQLVCETCRKLLLYPRGAKWVQCPGCQEVNLVLEAHQIGQVNCGGCAVLLMYQHGAPAVKCSTCQFVTQIGAHNRRPPLSVQQSQRRRRAIRGR